MYAIRIVEHSGYKHRWVAIDVHWFEAFITQLRTTPAWNDIKTVEWKGVYHAICR